MEGSQPHTSLHAPEKTMGTSAAQQLVDPQHPVTEVKSKRGIAASVLPSAQQATRRHKQLDHAAICTAG
jgi:hypothetical protein